MKFNKKDFFWESSASVNANRPAMRALSMLAGKFGMDAVYGRLADGDMHSIAEWMFGCNGYEGPATIDELESNLLEGEAFNIEVCRYDRVYRVVPDGAGVRYRLEQGVPEDLRFEVREAIESHVKGMEGFVDGKPLMQNFYNVLAHEVRNGRFKALYGIRPGEKAEQPEQPDMPEAPAQPAQQTVIREKVIIKEQPPELEMMLRQAIANSVVQMNLDEIHETIRERLVNDFGFEPQRHVVKVAEVEREVDEVVHEKFDELCHYVANDIPAYLYGAAGTGKGVLGRQVAQALGLDYHFMTSVTDEFKVNGYMDAYGTYHETPFYKAFKNGGVFFLDEMDASAPEVLVCLNMAISDRRYTFPHETVEAHPDFRVIAAGNTLGTGCLHGDTEVRIITPTNKQKHNITIENLYKQFHGCYDGNTSGLNKYFHNTDITIRCVNEETGEMTWTKVKDVYKSGVKECFKITDEEGRWIIASATHPFWTESGWKTVAELEVSDWTYIDAKRMPQRKRHRIDSRYTVVTVKWHPRLQPRHRTSPLRYTPLHRLVYEANYNGLELGEYIDKLNNHVEGDEWPYWSYDGRKYNIHHIDRNPQNNRIDNLELLTCAEHADVHGWHYYKKRSNEVELRKIVSIEPVGECETYDIECIDPHHNFMANDFIVHNSDASYSGRMQLDAASLNRFVVLEVDYDERIDEVCADGDKQLVNFAKHFRKVVKDIGLPTVCSYRNITQIRVAKEAMPLENALRSCLCKEMNQDDINIVAERMSSKVAGNEYLAALKNVKSIIG